MKKNNINKPLSSHSDIEVPTISRQKPAVKARQKATWTESSSDWDTPPHSPDPAPSPAEMALRARDLSVNYGTKRVLCNASFTLFRGDTLGLLGLNGAGKSTLLKVLAGALAPATGTVHIGDAELYQNPIQARMAIGYAPDTPAVYPEFKVNEFLRFIARMRRIPRTQIAAALDLVLDRCHLSEVRNRVIGNLSSGYQQRVNIAQALIHQPSILILDEPANGLDPIQLIEMRDLIAALAPDQATIFSSHLLPEVNSICNRVLLIHRGEQILDSSLKQLNNDNSNTFDLRLASDSANNDAVDLCELPGVAQAHQLSPVHWVVSGTSLRREHLQTMLSSRGHRIEELSSSTSYLESLFRQLALKDQAEGQTVENRGTQV